MEQKYWILGHCLAFEFFGGTPVIVVPDNLKTGVTKPNYYDPDINPTYADMARHYGAIILPTRVSKPNDKAKVENAVLHAERNILAVLRDYTFFGHDEANAAVSEELEKLNNRPFQKLHGSRTSWFLEIDKPALRPLPDRRYELRQWKRATVHMDYHVEFDKSLYSVPYQLVGKSLEILATQTLVEIYHQGMLVATHKRCGLTSGIQPSRSICPLRTGTMLAAAPKAWQLGPENWVNMPRDGPMASLSAASILSRGIALFWE